MKIQKNFFWGGGVGSGGGRVGLGSRVRGGQAGCERRIEVFVKIQKKKLGGGVRGGGSGWGGGGRVGGVRVDVNEELKFLCKFQKNKIFFWGVGLDRGGGGGVGGRVWGVQLGCERRIEVFGEKNFGGGGSGGGQVGVGLLGGGSGWM